MGLAHHANLWGSDRLSVVREYGSMVQTWPLTVWWWSKGERRRCTLSMMCTRVLDNTEGNKLILFLFFLLFCRIRFQFSFSNCYPPLSLYRTSINSFPLLQTLTPATASPSTFNPIPNVNPTPSVINLPNKNPDTRTTTTTKEDESLYPFAIRLFSNFWTF